MTHNTPIISDTLVQGSPEWLAARVGCVTMSNAGLLLTGGKGLTRKSYIIDVASEYASGEPAKQISTRDIERGNTLEPMARRAYELITGESVREVGLGYLDAMERISASPDGLTANGGIEIKCPQPKAHLRTILDAHAPKKYIPQMQGCMWVFGVEQWDFVSFCPQFKPMPIVIISVKRDEEMIAKISEQSHLAVQEIDEYVALAKMDVSPELQSICDQATFALDEIYDIEVEIT